MKWFNGKHISNKNVSIAGMIFAVLTLSLSVYVSNSPKQTKKVAKHHTQKVQVAKKLVKKVMKHKRVVQKAVAKVPVKKLKPVDKMANYNLVKKSLKAKPRIVAQVVSVKLRSNVHLGMDSWNQQHEQIESSMDKFSDDPVGAAAFEKKRIQEELAASGL